MASSSSAERKVESYLKPKLHLLFLGYTKVEGLSKSESINDMVNNFFQKLPESKRIEYIKAAQALEKKK